MNIQKMQTWALRAGFAWLAIAVLMTGAAGWSFGAGNVAKQFLFMFGFPLITIAAACLLPFLELCIEKRAVALSVLVGLAWGVCTMGEGFGHLMIVAGQRDMSTQASNVANTNYDAKQKAVTELEDKIKFLTARDAELRAANPFVTTVSADGLKGELDTLKSRMVEEEKGKRGRRAGKGKEFEELQNKANDAEKKLAAIATFNKQVEMMTATEDALKRARKELEGAKRGHSDAESQTKVVSRLFHASLNPNETQNEWSNLILELFFVACFLFGPMTLITVGVRDWNKPKNSFGVIARLRAWLNTKDAPSHTDVQARTPTAIDRLSQGVSTLHIGQGPARLVMTSKAC